MLIHEEEGENQTQQGTEDASAEFSGAWDDLDNAEHGQPEETQGRQEEAEDEEDQGGDEAGQSGDAPPSAAADQASGEVSDDLWANADPRLKAAFEQAEQARAQAEHQARSNGGRAGQLAKRLKELEAALGEKADSPENQKPDRKSQLEQAREEYPEATGALVEELLDIRQELQELKGSRQADTANDLDSILAEQPTQLTELHPDWGTLVLSPEFVAWRDDPNTPPVVKRIILEENAEQIVNAADCAFVLDLYKAGLEEGSSAAEEQDRKRERQLRAGSMPTTRTPPVQREQADSFDAEWERLASRERQRSYGRR